MSVAAPGQQSRARPHFGDRGDMERDFPDADVEDAADRPLQHAVDLRFDFAHRLGRRVGLAGQLRDERREPRQDRRPRSRRPDADDADDGDADDDDLGDVFEARRHVGALKENHVPVSSTTQTDAV